MANRYANLVGSNKIKDEYQKINQGFDKVEQEMDAKPDKSIAQVNDVQMGTDDTLTIEGSTGITVTTNPTQKKVIVTATGTSTPGPHGPSHNHDGADPIPDLVQVQEDLVSHENNILIHRQIHLSTNDPDPSFGGDGDIWLKYSDVPFYEHGEWVPNLEFHTNPEGLTLSRQDGFYVRQGKLVTVFYYIEVSSIGSGGSGQTRITGLPYPNNSKFSIAGALGEVRDLDIDGGTDFAALIPAGDNRIQIRRSRTPQNLQQSILYELFTDSTRIIGQISYFID